MPNKRAQPQPKQAAQTNKEKLEQYRAAAALKKAEAEKKAAAQKKAAAAAEKLEQYRATAAQKKASAQKKAAAQKKEAAAAAQNKAAQKKLSQLMREQRFLKKAYWI